MANNTDIWQQYYAKALATPHLKRTEFAVKINQSPTKVAIDCGCGTGSDMDYLHQQAYQVYGFDAHQDAVEICRQRFENCSLVEVSQDTFENYDYPRCGILMANSSLYFANPEEFSQTWQKIFAALDVGGVFVGDFMGSKDSWAAGHHCPTTPLTEAQVRALFVNFDIIRFVERDEPGVTALGNDKHWHTFSVVAVKS
ncbi:class I SAM-dependent methyltransferase [Vibrio tritonius]|uniref:Class I SAM-dependent methyltransferase n=1 Tax=Vibrio tritonius TaxID=1435069 RepID=A0ABS7YU14_9VIBR|nr:class I SAM-dependent methyltransferase [Vibrio tritonius]MCA2019170.1 class I SAM-dependent methyltransferase [Vibrio tritonius]